MKSSKIFFMLALLMALTITLTLTLTLTVAQAEDDQDLLLDVTNNEKDDDDALNETYNEELPTSSIRGKGRFLAQKSRRMTCNKYPRVCRAKGSPGPYCCKKKCVNVLTDRVNCGMCGNKCKFSELCCKGKCVNPLSNKNHCGGCNNKCNKKKRGSSCVYGMCSYA